MSSGTLMSFPPQADALTYEPYFGLTEKPFSLSSDPRFLYSSPSHAATFENLLGGIRRREGLLVLTGEIGTGKTTLCRAVLRSLRRKTFSSFVPDPFVSREDLLKTLLVDFGVISIQDLTTGPLRQASRTELSYLLSGFLDSLDALNAFVVVIIDEAQNMSLSLIEETRILSDTFGAKGSLQIVFVGQLELHAKLQLPEMRQVDQRVSSYSRLAPLTRDGVAGYVQHRLQVAGLTSERVLFPGDVIDLLHRRSGGVPRLVNRICDRALHLAHRNLAECVDRETLESALADVGATTLTPTWASIMFPDTRVAEQPSDTSAAAVDAVAAPKAQARRLPEHVEPAQRITLPAANDVAAPSAAAAPAVASLVVEPRSETQPVADVSPLFEDEDEFSKRVDDWLTQELAPVFRKPAPLQEFASEAERPPTVLVPPPRTTRVKKDASVLSKWLRPRDPVRSETYMARLGRVWIKRVAIGLLSVAALNAAAFGATQLPSRLTGLGLTTPQILPASSVTPILALPVPAVAAPPIDTSTASVSTVATSVVGVSGNYLVAVGLFAARERADALQQALSEAGFPVAQRPLQLRAQRLQQVVLGPFAQRADAVAHLERLRKLGGYDDANVIDLASPSVR